MSKITLVRFNLTMDDAFHGCSSLASHPLIEEVLEIGPRGQIESTTFLSGSAVQALIDRAGGDYLLLCLPGGEVDPGARMLERLLQVALETGAGIVYSDFRDRSDDQTTDHPLIDYQPGSIRDSFDFGSMVLVSRKKAQTALETHGHLSAELRWGGWYDLRLKISIDNLILRLPEPLYTRSIADLRSTGEKIFDYVDPSNRDFQIEMEEVATAHLKRVHAWLAPTFSNLIPPSQSFPVLASIIIPVRNRVKTIAHAAQSALSQLTDFPFNVIVVDNHSTDGTTELLVELASDNAKLKHVIPERTDLGIGGCWNEAVYSQDCGRYALQLDSDDIYSGDSTLAKVVNEFKRGGYAMLIGSYTIVDFELNEMPPGLIDHREWTRENGRNNALRINGLGAPRAFDVAVLREIGLPNVSYGEDYAVALRLSREYEIGRIYESLYYARRWSGNSDSALPLQTANRYDTYKDRIRTIEIVARQRFNSKKGE